VVFEIRKVRTVRGAIGDAAGTVRAIDEIDRMHAIDADEQDMLDALFVLVSRSGSLDACTQRNHAEQQCGGSDEIHVRLQGVGRETRH